MIAIFKPGKGSYGNNKRAVTANDILLFEGSSSSSSSSTKIRGGLQDDSVVEITANTPYKYTLPEASKLYGLELQSDATIKVGTATGTDDLGEFEGLAGEVLNFHLLNASEIWIESTINTLLIPIIYKRSTDVGDETTTDTSPPTFIFQINDVANSSDKLITATASEDIQGTPTGWLRVNSTTFTKQVSNNGTYTITARDLANNTGNGSYTVSTISTVTTPKITPISNVTSNVEEAITPIEVVVDDPNASVEVKYLPNGLTYNPTTKQITGTPTTTGTTIVSISATNTAGTSTIEFSVLVNSVATEAPTVNITSTVFTGQIYNSVTVQFTKSDPNAVVSANIDSPAFLTISNDSVIFNSHYADSFPASITVTNSKGSNTANFTIVFTE